jgi:hypothetical protein
MERDMEKSIEGSAPRNTIRVNLMPDGKNVFIETSIGGKPLAWIELNAIQLDAFIECLQSFRKKLEPQPEARKWFAGLRK